MNDMSPVEEIFFNALEKKTSADRAAYLDHACAADAGLRSRVEKMLAAHSKVGGFLDSIVAGEVTRSYEPLSEGPGMMVGPYKLLQQIGEGGMGTVFMAEQEKPVRRKVALKIIKPGMDSKQVIARFEAERQALAMMDHVNIAKVLDAGATESGRPYFVMELVHGVPITEYCDANKLTPQERLELFVPVCQAIQHAHQKGIIHRDIKPSNVLVTMYDDRPVPKVIDFGVAKAIEHRLTEKTLFTQYGALVGTLEYMSPEQAEMNAFGVDTRSDVYSLGVLLYELLTGTTPLERTRLRESAFNEIIRLIKEEEPPRPSVRLSTSGTLAKLAEARKTEARRLPALVRGELDWIVMKCLEKDRTRRYDGTSALTKDVQRHLAGEAVEACPPTLGYRLRKAYRKNKTAILTASSFAAVLLVATCVSLAFGILAKQAERRAIDQERVAMRNAEEAIESRQAAQQERDQANAARQALEDEQNSRARSDYVSSIKIAQAAWQQNLFKPTREILDQTRPALRGWEWHYLNRLCQSNELYSLPTDGTEVSACQYSPDGRWIVTVGSSVQVWGTTTRQPFTLCEVADWAGVDISPDSRRVLVSEKNKVTIWDLETRTPQPPLVDDIDEQMSFSACFSPDGKTIAISRKGWPDKKNMEVEMVSLWDSRTGKRIWSYNARNLRFFGPRTSFAADGRWVYATVWSPDTTSVWKEGAVLKIWDVDTGEELLSVGQKRAACLSPDGSRVAAMDTDNHVSVWRIRRDGDRPVLDEDPIVLRGHIGTSTPRTFSRDGKYLLTAGTDDTVRIWDAATGAQLCVLVGAGFVSADFSPDAKHVITWGGRYEDGLRVWAVQVADPQVVSEAEARVYTSVPSPDGKLLLVFDESETKVCEARTLKPLHKLAIGRGGWSPDGRRIWISSDGDPASGTKNIVRVYDAETGQLLTELEGVGTPRSDHCFNADGSQILTVKEDGSSNVWDWNTDQIRELAKPAASEYVQVGYSPDGTKIFITRQGERNSNWVGLSIVDAETHKSIELETDDLELRSNVTFSRDGRTFLGLFGNSDSPRRIDCRVWDANTGKLLHSFPTSAWSSLDLQISPDGSRILITCFLDKVLLIDAASGDELLALPFSGLQKATFNWDGSKIIVRAGREVRVLDGTPLTEPTR